MFEVHHGPTLPLLMVPGPTHGRPFPTCFCLIKQRAIFNDRDRQNTKGIAQPQHTIQATVVSCWETRLGTILGAQGPSIFDRHRWDENQQGPVVTDPPVAYLDSIREMVRSNAWLPHLALSDKKPAHPDLNNDTDIPYIPVTHLLKSKVWLGVIPNMWIQSHRAINFQSQLAGAPRLVEQTLRHASPLCR